MSTFDGENYYLQKINIKHPITIKYECKIIANGLCKRYYFLVTDFKEPVITCPQSKKRYADELTNSTAVTWILPTVVDNSGEVIVPQQTTNFVVGSRFEIGDYTVLYQATDSTGNAATCSFVVTVERKTFSVHCIEIQLPVPLVLQ